MNEDQLVVAQFAADLVANLGYVDQQTTNRPSQQPPALRTNAKDFITDLVKQTRSTPSNQQQLIPSPAPASIPQVSMPIQQPSVQQPTIGQINQLSKNPAQLELVFDINEKTQIIKNFEAINLTLNKILKFLNENCTKRKSDKSDKYVN